MKYLLILLLGVTSTLLNAKVLDKAADGFTLEISFETKADAKTAYNQFINVGDWWNSEHTWFGDASRMYIEPSVNGCFCEIDGEKQALHMTISYVDPYKEMRMIGGLGPLQGLGLHGGMSWKFDTLDNGNTKITHRYQVTGYMQGGLEGLANIVDSVQAIQMKGLEKALTIE